MTESIRFMGAISMKPNGSMCAHNNHGINYQHDSCFPCQKVNQKNNKQRKHAGCHEPADKRDPIFPRLEYIDS